MANENKMGYLPIKKLILQMSLPPMCSMFLQYSYNLVVSKVLFFLSKITCDQNVDTDPNPDGQGDHKGCDREGKRNCRKCIFIDISHEHAVNNTWIVGSLDRRYLYQYPCTIDHETVLFSIHKQSSYF